MDSRPTTILLCPPVGGINNENVAAAGGGVYFDSSSLRKQTRIPKAFVWPRSDRQVAIEELDAPVVDLHGFLHGDEASTRRAAELVRLACERHGFFQVTNHGVAEQRVRDAMDCTDAFFKLQLPDKLRARRKPGSLWGYSGAHADRFSSKLPWKETLSFGHHDSDESIVVDYFASTMGKNFDRMGKVYQMYCESMKKLSLAIMELLAISLGIERSHYRELFEEGRSIMRCNYYPPCQEPEMTMGTGPHCDPTALTILNQDEHVGGLEVFASNKWQAVRPLHNALVINIGDTFMALSNGRYKSCLHRAVVHRHRERRSLAYFACPREDKVIRPPADLSAGGRLYPDFTWAQFVEFTHYHYRADVRTLHTFANWIQSSSASTAA
ncbi:gibberellin 20 oxidase 2-like [Zingiber officinale]|uniref:gibberellin 20 oxidase 2-like n=1 Tax=Zingiber officinale TaxID=94328 RepID=UPI001C4B1E33|nr:gibberellin 20 oxidase 2-like [Zingiber officinale]